MNDLNNSTVEELIEKMVRKNYIDVKEKSTIDGMLRNVTGNIRDKNERILFINTLSLKLDAQNNEFVTPNGLNYASFESFLKETVDEVKKVKTAEELPTIDITEEPKKEEENFDIEKYEAEVKSNLDDLLKYIGLEGITFSTEEVAEIAEKQRVAEKIGKRFKEKLETRIDKKQALEETCQELGILQEEIESPEMLMACLNIGKKIVKEIQQEKNISEEEAEREFLDGDYFVAITMLDMCKKAGKAEKTLKSISNLILREYKTKKLEQAEAKLMKKIHDEKVTPQSLLSAIKNKMKKTQELRIIEQENDELEKKLSSEIKVKRKEFFQKLTNDFITTRKTMSEMYEELMENPDFDPEDLQYDKFEFEDVMDGIIDSLDGNVKSLLGEEHLKVLKENELIYRQYDILEKNFNVAIEDLDEKKYSYAEEKKEQNK